MFKNSPLENDVIARLEDDPRIAVRPRSLLPGDGGIVTLRGTVERFSQRRAAEHDARGVEGVYEVINHLKVNLPGADRREDDEIRGAALQESDLGCRGSLGFHRRQGAGRLGHAQA